MYGSPYDRSGLNYRLKKNQKSSLKGLEKNFDYINLFLFVLLFIVIVLFVLT